MKHSNCLLNPCTRVLVLTSMFIFILSSDGFAVGTSSVETWIQNNPTPSDKELISFINTELSNVSDIEDSYSICNTILEYYAPDQIPYEFYVIYGKIVSLKFDFGTSSIMYYAAYELSDNKEYLLQSIIQEYESGNIHSAAIRLQELLAENISPDIRVTATILLSNIAVASKNYKLALQILHELRTSPIKHTLTARYYSQWYTIASLSGNTLEANTARQILETRFPRSLEAYSIDSPSVNTLPLPSTIFTSINQNFSTIAPSATNAGKNNNPSKDKYSSYKIWISTHPLVGYQVAAYKDINNAKTSYAYYLQLWKERGITTEEPIVTTKNILGNTYYQILFPLQEAEEKRESQTNTLIEQGIEGFVVTNDSSY